jgi:hypothetical protein
VYSNVTDGNSSNSTHANRSTKRLPFVLPECLFNFPAAPPTAFAMRLQCVSKLWIVGPINSTMPGNLWIAQKQARADALKPSG